MTNKETKYVDIRVILVEEEDKLPELRGSYLIKTNVQDTKALAEHWGQNDDFHLGAAHLIIDALGEY